MGCDIHGFVEIRPYPKRNNDWTGLFAIDYILSRNYDLFGLLFDVRNYSHFVPVAARRGLPEDVSEEASEECGSWGMAAHSKSYITYFEIKDIDWSLETDEIADWISVYENEKLFSVFMDWSGLSRDEFRRLHMGEIIEKDGKIYKCEKTKYISAKDSNWNNLVAIMRILADKFGMENVRLVVWFDN